jgi:CheY-like chemotaxis protein
MVCGGLRIILEDQPDVSMVAEAVNLARRLRPDVYLVDIRMPGSTASRSPAPWPARRRRTAPGGHRHHLGVRPEYAGNPP